MAKIRSKDIKQILEYEINYAKNEDKGHADWIPIKTLKDILALICKYENKIERLKTKIIKQDQTIIENNFELVELEESKKQAQIDVLNKVKKHIYDISPYNPFATKDNVKYFIDELIKEVEHAD